ncbi:MAG: sugar ABC transporter substrate-binding protein, partial [Oscillospiraceae bacterium]|nr:sugar ABC transporter substrate-binding protein [Oscillospiraceae bacterium]
TLIQDIASGKSEATNWGIVKYPHQEGVEAGTTLGTITSLGVNAKSEHQETALDFVNFVSGTSGAGIIADTGTFPAIKTEEVISKIASMDGFPTDENSIAALQTVKTYLEMPLSEDSAEIEVVLNEVHDSIMTENISIDDGIAEMNERVTEILNAAS